MADIDPNKFYFEDAQGNLTEGKAKTKEEGKAMYKANRERFLASREKARNMPTPPPDRPTGTQAGHAITNDSNHTRTVK